MTLRTSALYAGLLGVVLLAVGLIADAQRPETTVVASVSPDTSIVSVPADILALEGATRIAFEAEGPIEAHSARPIDAETWLTHRTTTFITGLPTWEELSARKAERVTAEPSPSPSASPSPSPEPEAAPAEEAEETAPVTSTDHWRDTWKGENRLSMAVSAVGAGHTLVIESLDGTPISTVELTIDREVNDNWITPLIWWGGALTAVGAIALFLTLVDVRPAQRKVEQWMFDRKRPTDSSVAPGTRRARRLEGAAIPTASLDAVEADAEISAGAERSQALQAEFSAAPNLPLTMPVSFTPQSPPQVASPSESNELEQKGDQA